MTELNKFKALGLSDTLIESLNKKGFEEPSPIQAKCIPVLLKGDHDVVGQAQTGTGKTAAFGLPLIDRLKAGTSRYPQALILAPTRELAIQVAEELNSLKGKSTLQIITIYGGQHIGNEITKLKRSPDIVVGTAGRVMDHIRRGTLVIDKLEYFILDEADEMLNMGFLPDVEEILSKTNKNKKMLFFSATMPREILNIARKTMTNHEVISVKNEQFTADSVNQLYFEVRNHDKFEALCRIIDVEPDFYGIVFCRTKREVDQVVQQLIYRGYTADGLHGDIAQNQRERVLKKFKDKKITILVATDVAARGIDINDLTHVINHSLPQDPESYIHRVGRTGRAGKKGTAINFVTPNEYRSLMYIKNKTKTDIKKGNLPNIADIIGVKKNKIVTTLSDLMEKPKSEEFLKLAKELLVDSTPENVIASILEHSFSGELEQATYKNIQSSQRKSPVDNTGITRLFVALGRKDEITKTGILDIIKKEVSIDTAKIRTIEIFEEFSFINAPFKEAEMILGAFKENKRGSKSLIEKAKPRKSDSDDRRGGGGFRGGRGNSGGGYKGGNRGGYSRGGGDRRSGNSSNSRSNNRGKSRY